MEDILASIRRIIADDQQSNGPRRRGAPQSVAAAPVAPAPQAPVVADEEVLDLARYALGQTTTDDAHRFAAEPTHVAEPEPVHPAPDFEAEPAASHGFEESGAVPHAAAEPYAETYEPAEESKNLSLLAPPMSESVMSAFEALAATVVLENKPMLERILRDLLRPMLKAWLDDNLPAMVERLVRLEIERVARGGRG